MPKDWIDLHCHSTASDGRLTPVQLIELGKKLELRAIALTDHDTVAGLRAFHDAGRAQGIETISGVEISAEYPRGTMHIVGLFVDTQSQALRSFLKKLSDGRKVRNPQIVNRLHELGLEITMQEVEEEAGCLDSGPDGSPGDNKSVGRPHIAAVMIRKGYVKTKQDAFDKFLAKGRPAYFTRFAATPEETIQEIHSAGGLAVLAHPPYLKAKDEAELDGIVGELKSKGLDGIEVWYSTHTPEDTANSARLAAKYGLVSSGGSDFHGEAGRGNTTCELGSGVGGNLCIPYAVLEKLKARRR